MTTIAPDRPEVEVKPGFAGFVQLAEAVGFNLEPFQRRIVKAALGPERELVVLCPRGQGKTCLQALVALHHLCTVEEAEIFCCASSRDQAKILFQYAARYARALDHPNVVHRHLELRWCPDPDEPKVYTRFLRVLPAEAPRLYGLTPSLMFLDEMQALDRDDVYVALSSALHKRQDAKLIVVSTAGQGAESPLGRLRQRALGLPDVKHRGFVTEAHGPDLAMLEWAVPDDAEITPSVVKKANPASWITTDAIRSASDGLPELAFRRFVANQWTARIGSWLPAGSWQSAADPELRIEPGEEIWLGVDLGGARADTALVWMTRDKRVGCRIFSGEDGISDAAAFIPELAERYLLREVVFDPWRAAMLVRGLEDRRIQCTAFQQSDSRMLPASASLHRAIVEGEIRHPDDPRLNEHIAAAVARHGRRGWRIDQAERGTPIDGAVALVMAHEAATAPPPPPTRVLGWL
jgi:phage terminase large subunit-like protein